MNSGIPEEENESLIIPLLVQLLSFDFKGQDIEIEEIGWSRERNKTDGNEYEKR